MESDFPENYFDSYVASGYFTRETVGNENRIKFNTAKTTFCDGDWVENNIAVPKYDRSGREIDYRAVEVSKTYPTTAEINGVDRTVGFYSTYAWNVTYTGAGKLTTNYNYIVTNHRTIEGNDHSEIAVNKEWVDDGELEYRQPIQIIANNVGSHIVETTVNGNTTTQVVADGTKNVTLNKINVWEGRFNVSQYEKDENNQYVITNGHYNLLTYQHDMTKFSEAPENPDANETYYWSLADIKNLQNTGNLADELKWIYQLLTSNNWSNGTETVSLTPTNKNSIDLKESNFINFQNFAGIYKSKPLGNDPKRCHYYAVRQVYDNNGVNGTVGTLHFINTRIGVISYEVQFDWKVGDALKNGDIKSVTISIENPAINGGKIEQSVDFTELTPLSNGNYAYYILNLPKYDTNGKLIDYQINELSITDGNGISHTVDNTKNEAIIGTDKCKVTISSETIIEGAEAKTDDLHRIIISNTFEDETDITVHKRWYDNTNAENTRFDLYIKLHWISEQPNSTEQTSIREYGWNKHEHDTDNRIWSFAWIPTGICKYRRCKQSESIYKQHFNNVAYDNGTIINRLYGEMTVKGEKLWKNISPILDKEDYPIANVKLLRDNNIIEIENWFEEEYDADPSLSDLDDALKKEGVLEDEIATLTTRQQKIDKLVEIRLSTMSEEDKIKNIKILSETQVRSGATSFKFTSVTDEIKNGGFVVLENGAVKTENGNIVLPKYDEVSRRITYTMKEQPINGYIPKIEPGSQKLINEYNGGRKLKFTVTKHWSGMENEKVFPTITFTLHQVFRINKGTEQQPNYKYYVYNQFKRDIRVNKDDDYTVTFGGDDHKAESEALRYYSPIGEPFIYFITETLSNYDGEQAIFIDPQYENYITEYLAPFNDTANKKYNKIQLVNNQGQAMGFTCTVTDSLDNTEQLARTAAIASLNAEHTGEENYTPTEEEIVAQIQKELNNENADALNHSETVTNTYKPDDSNFHGMIDVSKSWERNNAEHNEVKAYSFTLSRKTRLLNSETLFTVNTTDMYSARQSPTLVPNEENEYTLVHDFKACSSYETDGTIVETINETSPKFYIAKVKKQNDTSSNPIIVVIDVADDSGTLDYHNDVHIRNLAVYGQDALKYTYTITEIPKDGYTAKKSSESKQLVEDIPQSMTLENTLDVFNLKVYKSFGREYQDSDNNTYIEPIPENDFAQFFNDAYFNQLTFNLYRKTDTTTEPYTPYRTIEGKDINKKIVEGENVTWQRTNDNFDSDKNAYYYIFENLPLTDVNGNYYTYWIEEIDGAQTDSENKHVSTYYSNGNAFGVTRESIAETVSVNDNNSSVSYQVSDDCPITEITMEKSDNGKEKSAYIQNVFEAKKISIKKYWLDNNNEDGLRPDELTATIYEKIDEGNVIEFTRTLKKEQNSNEVGWTMKSALARYYFNGITAVDSLTYKISETLPDGYTLIETAGTYGGSTNNDPNTYTIPGTVNTINVPLSDTDFKSITGEGEQTLNLTNYKKPQKGEITLKKAFNPKDENFKTDTRPNNLYFKLTDENGNVFTNYSSLMVTVEVGNNISTPDVNGVITVPRNTDFSYPNITISNLPIRSNEKGSVQTNGSFTDKQYKFVECQADGIDLADTFPYEWSGSETVNLTDSTKNYADTYEITNTLKTENHTVQKKWNDDANNNIPNYYNTRETEFHVIIERTLVKNSTNDADWTPFYDNNDIKLDTVMNSSDYTDYSANTKFRNLPQYDKEGNKYYYRVRETYIGSNDEQYNEKYKANHVYHDAVENKYYSASNVYYIIYDDNYSDNVTTIDNHLIRRTEYQNFIAEKKWTDNDNQDGKRQPIKVVLEQSITSNGQKVIVQSLEETLDESNNWHYQWENYPLNDSEGTPYQYDVYEIPISEYNIPPAIRTIYSTDEGGERFGETSFEKKEFTNTHDQLFKSLTINKLWQGDENYKALRPESITFELYCKYKTYKYVSEDPDTHIQTDLTTDNEKEIALNTKTLKIVEDTTYDGPLSEAVEIVGNGSTIVGKYPYASNRIYTQTLTPDDKTNNNQWSENWTKKENGKTVKKAVTFDNLPVYINTCGDDRWNGKAYAIEYYVKEVNTLGDNNPYNLSVNGFKTDGEGTSNAEALVDNTTKKETDKTVTVTNELKTRDITVEKTWNDSGYTDILHYDIDFTLSGSGATNFSYSETQNLPAYVKKEDNTIVNPVTAIPF